MKVAKPAAKPKAARKRRHRFDGRVIGDREIIGDEMMSRARQAMYLRLHEQMSWAEIAQTKWPLDDSGVPAPEAKALFSSGILAQRVVKEFIVEMRTEMLESAADMVNAHYRQIFRLCSLRYEQDGSDVALEGMFAALERLERIWTGANGSAPAIQAAPGEAATLSVLPAAPVPSGTPEPVAADASSTGSAPPRLLTNTGGVSGLMSLHQRALEAKANRSDEVPPISEPGAIEGHATEIASEKA